MSEAGHAMAPQPVPQASAGRGGGSSGPEGGPGDCMVNPTAPTPRLDLGFLPIPRRLRHSEGREIELTMFMNVVFGVASSFTAANLYYCQPLLIQFAETFGVSYEEVSRIPTLVQAGYAAGILLISPLGDLVRRRPLLLLLLFLSATLTIGLCITHSLAIFETLTFLIGVTSVTPQVLTPLAADLAPPHRRASAVAMVLSGLLLGIVVARVFAGVIAQFVTWRAVYFFAVAIQYAILGLLYFILPDRPPPPKNAHLSYFGILFSMAKLAFTEPVLVQACLISVASTAMFTSFWVTLTFLLGGPPYHYSTLDIGLFGLVGMFGVLAVPLTGRFVDRLVPWVATFIATTILLVTQAIQTAIGGVSIAGPIIVCFGIDLGRQMQQVSLISAVFSINAEARSRLNAVLILWIFLGQVMGTAVGAHVYNTYGWRMCSVVSLAWVGWQFLVLVLRGPHCGPKTWGGWEGGASPRRAGEEEKRQRLESMEQNAKVS